MDSNLVIRCLLALRQLALPTVVKQAQLVYEEGHVAVKSFEEYEAYFTVRSVSGKSEYEVNIYNLDDPTEVWGDCTCPYSDEGVCKHVLAACYTLEVSLRIGSPIHRGRKSPDELVQKKIININKVSKPVAVPPKPVVPTWVASDTTLNLKNLGENQIRPKVADNFWSNRRHYQNVRSIEQGKGYETFELSLKKYGTYRIRISRVQKGTYHLSCSCNQTLKHPICEHQMGVLLWMANLRGIQALELLRDWTTEKNALLVDYGYSMQDSLTHKFEFKIDPSGDNLELILLDKSIQRISGNNWDSLFKSTLPSLTEQPIVPITTFVEPSVYVYLLEKFTRQTPPFFELTLCQGKLNTKTGKLTQVARMSPYDRERPTTDAIDLEIMNLGRMLTTNYLNEWLTGQGFKLGKNYWNINYSNEAREALLQWSLKLLDRLLPLLASRPVRILKGEGYSVGSVVTVDERPLTLRFQLSRADGETLLQATVQQGNDEPIPFNRLTDTGSDALVLVDGDRLCRYQSLDTAKAARQFMDMDGALRFRSLRDEQFFNGFLIPLANRFAVDFDQASDITKTDLEFREGRIYLKEDENNLLIVPAFGYATDEEPDIELPRDFRPARVVAYDGAVQLQKRDPDAENEFMRFIQQQHPDFAHQSDQFFYLPTQKVLENGWLFHFYEALRQNQTRLFGFSSLKKFRYNPNAAAFNIRSSSGIDWFDLKVEISFGDQAVALADVRKAILRRQNYVELGDGTIGVLPDEWIAQHAQLFRLGQIDDKKGNIRLSKRHFSILEHYRERISDPKLLKELDDKKEKLLNFQKIKKVKLPSNIQATLRPYQEEGYRCLHFLDEFGWGGCLADDMGLGKTLQMLTFLQEQKNRRPDGIHLVVVPKTLIFNWQAEATRFCSKLRLLIHTGTGRVKTFDKLADVDIVLTTYGAVRTDIEWLREFKFDYVILDEAQAIKNPDSLIAKSVRLLQARNRLTMTGTPVENNTFDLYAQFDFLNPGFLGSAELFRTEYANPIDKHQDKARAAELRQLIYPFMLKRTKEEVAKDLPEKTEIVLYCEMDKQQRRVYEAYRDRYRDLIEKRVAEVGAEQSAFLILEGLLKLRQICDSPALLNDEEDYGNESAKLDELVREIGQNASNHKIVIFSQFLGMLDQIRQKLERDRVPYEYLDGQTNDRASRVQNFQANDECRVFLMSLKAGGVGLNLTEADYVYLVDPWWNPAVEQQAIDRVHRIGQTKRVFAYRMICKDTVEEKILLLQDRKRALASDLISTETGFLKKLSPKDILGLFS
ncbi:DEAD/DEAH box helicase [Spirosoma foliorum]|uniref:SNF2 helicase associated domain-containing protein n=1 Tax=Spirosoma foliorum TaxID=2710596 RepID=A0A7G5GS13_9BACT|nr:DEAD/DEAH box helicase [Spirosoma foliorum]QMW01655.1 SNF2 helicase associated domain-containing protein [Spirosoma foliorum]